MNQNVVTTTPNSDLRNAAAQMIDEKLGCLPVVHKGILVGIITEADFMTLAWETLGRTAQRTEPAPRSYEMH